MPPQPTPISLFLQLGGSSDKVTGHSRVLTVSSFNSAKKRMGVAVKDSEGRVRLHWKGAAEIIVEECTHLVDETGTLQIVTDEKVGSFLRFNLFLLVVLLSPSASCLICHQNCSKNTL